MRFFFLCENTKGKKKKITGGLRLFAHIVSSLNDQDLNISSKKRLTITNKNVWFKCSHKAISSTQKQGLWKLLKHHFIVLFNSWSKSGLRQLKIVCELEINFIIVLKEPIFQVHDWYQLTTIFPLFSRPYWKSASFPHLSSPMTFDKCIHTSQTQRTWVTRLWTNERACW